MSKLVGVLGESE